MESVLGRYRNLVVLVGVLFAQVLGLAVQVRRTNTASEPTRLIRIWAVGAVTPFEKAIVWMQTATGNVWHNYVYLRGVRAENRDLKAQIEQMRIQQVRMSQDADQARRLRVSQAEPSAASPSRPAGSRSAAASALASWIDHSMSATSASGVRRPRWCACPGTSPESSARFCMCIARLHRCC